MQERRLAAGTRGAIYTSRKGTAGQKGSAFSESIEKWDDAPSPVWKRVATIMLPGHEVA